MTSQRRIRPGSSDDRGMTLVELLVAMSIFTVVVAVFLSGVVGLTRSTVRNSNEADVAADLRRVFAQVDRTVRYADAVNYPGTAASGAWYVEVRSSTQRGKPPVCTQWRWTPATTTGRLEVRSWTASAAPTAASWRVLATTVVGPTSTAPFTMTPAGIGSSRVRQSLRVDLVAAKGTGSTRAEARTTTEFVARNSSQSSPGNAAITAGVGTPLVSATPACGALASTRT